MAPRVYSCQEQLWPRDDIDLLEACEIAFRLELTPPELKLTYSALTALLNDFEHDE